VLLNDFSEFHDSDTDESDTWDQQTESMMNYWQASFWCLAYIQIDVSDDENIEEHVLQQE